MEKKKGGKISLFCSKASREEWPASSQRELNVLRLFFRTPWNMRCSDKNSLRWAWGGIYDSGDFTEPFHRFPCSSQNSRELIHSPALKTWTSLKENGGEKKKNKNQRDPNSVCLDIRDQMVARASKEEKASIFPLASVQPVKINVPRKYCRYDLPIPPHLGAAAHHKNVFSCCFM